MVCYAQLRVDGQTNRVYALGPLHPSDAALLFVNRLPRELTPQDSKSCSQFKSLDEFSRLPLMARLNGCPGLIELAAELLNHTLLDSITYCVTAPHLDTKQWPAQVPEVARPLLLQLRARIAALAQVFPPRPNPFPPLPPAAAAAPAPAPAPAPGAAVSPAVVPAMAAPSPAPPPNAAEAFPAAPAQNPHHTTDPAADSS